MKILIVNGPNMNFLGIREPEIYGRESYADLCELIRRKCDSLDLSVDFFQSNHEGAIVDRIQEAYGNTDGIVINPAAYTHTSVAIHDALKAVGIPAVEVHMSDTAAREDFRHRSYTAPACICSVVGHGMQGYVEAVDQLYEYLTKERSK